MAGEKITFACYGYPTTTVTKEQAETLLRKRISDDRVDLILLNVLSGRPMTLTLNDKVFVIKLGA